MLSSISNRAGRQPLPIVIFGDTSDTRLIALKCLLLKSGVHTFVSGQLDECGRCTRIDCPRAGLFIVSRESFNPDQMESISAEASRLAALVLHL